MRGQPRFDGTKRARAIVFVAAKENELGAAARQRLEYHRSADAFHEAQGLGFVRNPSGVRTGKPGAPPVFLAGEFAPARRNRLGRGVGEAERPRDLGGQGERFAVETRNAAQGHPAVAEMFAQCRQRPFHVGQIAQCFGALFGGRLMGRCAFAGVGQKQCPARETAAHKVDVVGRRAYDEDAFSPHVSTLAQESSLGQWSGAGFWPQSILAAERRKKVAHCASCG